MSAGKLLTILERLSAREIEVREAWGEIRNLSSDNLNFACLDHGRLERTGIPEVVYAHAKTPQQVAAIVERFVERSGRAIATRVSPQALALVREKFSGARFFETARILAVGDFPEPPPSPYAAVISAGTSDIPVAEEAAVTLELLGTRAVKVFDVGVAGLHRLMDKLELLRGAAAIVAVAGMEGALPTVVGGLVPSPVIAVPTSVGYGASFDGLAALLTMMNSCVPGVAVVNIDNGFGGGAMAHIIAERAAK